MELPQGLQRFTRNSRCNQRVAQGEPKGNPGITKVQPECKRKAKIANVKYGVNIMLEPIEAAIVNRPRPKMPDRMLTLDEYMNYVDDLACWRADKAEALLSGVKE